MSFYSNVMPKRFGIGKPKRKVVSVPFSEIPRRQGELIGRMPRWQEEAFAGQRYKDMPK